MRLDHLLIGKTIPQLGMHRHTRVPVKEIEMIEKDESRTTVPVAPEYIVVADIMYPLQQYIIKIYPHFDFSFPVI